MPESPKHDEIFLNKARVVSLERAEQVAYEREKKLKGSPLLEEIFDRFFEFNRHFPSNLEALQRQATTLGEDYKKNLNLSLAIAKEKEIPGLVEIEFSMAQYINQKIHDDMVDLSTLKNMIAARIESVRPGNEHGTFYLKPESRTKFSEEQKQQLTDLSQKLFDLYTQMLSAVSE